MPSVDTEYHTDRYHSMPMTRRRDSPQKLTSFLFSSKLNIKPIFGVSYTDGLSSTKVLRKPFLSCLRYTDNLMSIYS